MRRSKLEMYVDILTVMAQKGPLKVTHIMYKANVNGSLLKTNLDYLMAKGLVEKKLFKRQIVFAVTAQGITVLKYFRELKQALPFEEETEISRAPMLY
jgi:predicted transcriptional regulator